jgi:SAM-dependent methyltransferase
VTALELEGLSGLGTYAADRVCRNCGGRGLHCFHAQEGIPVHSCRLVGTEAAAREFPTGDLELGFCARCGFIANTAYDPAPQDYGESYEETQAFSPRFREFQRDLAARWVERYGLRGKDVLEIGCGKASFLVDMVELGVRHAVGIDPAIAQERLDPALAGRMTLIADYYSERHAELTGDAVICRHTLEHIQPTADFMRVVRRSLDGRPDTPVLFELPDALRVLREVAFWDIYYEHCSYFTPGSLARLYRLAGFDVLDLELDYDDQYILIEGRPSAGVPASPLPLEESPAELAGEVRSFRSRFAALSRTWRERLDAARADGRRVVVWGGGSKAVSFLTTLGIAEQVECAVDINPFKQGKFIAGTGHEVVAPEALKERRPDLVVAMNPIYLEEIGGQLASLGVSAELVAV